MLVYVCRYFLFFPKVEKICTQYYIHTFIHLRRGFPHTISCEHSRGNNRWDENSIQRCTIVVAFGAGAGQRFFFVLLSFHKRRVSLFLLRFYLGASLFIPPFRVPTISTHTHIYTPIHEGRSCVPRHLSVGTGDGRYL